MCLLDAAAINSRLITVKLSDNKINWQTKKKNKYLIMNAKDAANHVARGLKNYYFKLFYLNLCIIDDIKWLNM